MRESRRLWKPRLIKSLKMAAAAFAAIALAEELGLRYAATAGIVTVLSIQNTKRETLKSAGKRWLAFLCALAISLVCFSLIGYRLWAFGAYLFLLSHFLTEQGMGPELIANEAMLLLIGTGAGIAVNLHLHRQQAEFERLAGNVDGQMKGILHRMSLWLPREDKDGYNADCFLELKKGISRAKDCAVSNYGNTVLSKSVYELDYVAMREQQGIVLREIYDNILRIQYLPKQAEQVAGLLGQIGEDFHRDNTVEGLLEQRKAVLDEMKSQPLPDSREEFEARAVLFYILMQIKQFLEIKKEFMRAHGEYHE